MPRFWPGRRLADVPHDLSWRELRTFIRNLPPESAYARAVHGEQVDWRVGEHLLARISNILQQANSGRRVPPSQLIHPPGTGRADRARARGHQKAGGLKELNALFDGR